MNRILFLFLFASIHSYAQDTEFNRKDDGLSDKVKKITAESYNYFNNQKELMTTNVFYYDRIGMGIKTITIHDFLGNEQISYGGAFSRQVMLSGGFADSTIYLYNGDNKLIEKQFYDPTGAVETDHYTYNDLFTVVKSEVCYNGNCITTGVKLKSNTNLTNLTFDSLGSVHTYHYQNRNENDSVIEVFQTDGYETESILINKKNKTKFTKFYYGTDTLNLQLYYITNLDESLKNALIRRVYGPDKKTLLEEYYYKYKDDNSLEEKECIEEKVFNDKGQLINATFSHTNETIQIKLDQNGNYDTTISKFVRISDEHGNWTNEKWYNNGELYFEINRTIEYYQENDPDGYKYVYKNEMSRARYKHEFCENDSLRNSLKIRKGKLQLLVKSNDYSQIHIYLINKTDSSVIYKTDLLRIPMIREALNEKGEWQPIEYWQWAIDDYDSPKTILPDGEIHLSGDLYGGNIKTKIRFKMRLNSNCILYSDSYDGWVNANQFVKPKETIDQDFLNF